MPTMRPDERAQSLYELLKPFGYACQVAFGEYSSLELCLICAEYPDTLSEIRKHLFEQSEGAIAALEGIGYTLDKYELRFEGEPLEASLRLLLGEKR